MLPDTKSIIAKMKMLLRVGGIPRTRAKIIDFRSNSFTSEMQSSDSLVEEIKPTVLMEFEFNQQLMLMQRAFCNFFIRSGFQRQE